jgi:hypothetical protein
MQRENEFQKIAIGDSGESVKKRLGEPSSTEIRGGVQCWYFPEGHAVVYLAGIPLHVIKKLIVENNIK